MSNETMKRDFERLAKERFAKIVEDLISLYDVANLDREDAFRGIVYALLTTLTRMIAWHGEIPSRDGLYVLIDSLLRSATKLAERVNEAERRGLTDV